VREFPRKLRINTQLQAELAALIREELSDPRVAGVTVTGVDVTADLRNARVTVSSLGTDAELAAAVKGLSHAAGKLRHELGRRLSLRVAPQLYFTPDTALRDGDRISAMIRDAITQDTEHEASRQK